MVMATGVDIPYGPYDIVVHCSDVVTMFLGICSNQGVQEHLNCVSKRGCDDVVNIFTINAEECIRILRLYTATDDYVMECLSDLPDTCVKLGL